MKYYYEKSNILDSDRNITYDKVFKMSDDELSYLDSFYPYLISQIQQNELSTVFMKSDLFTNNFMSVFTQRILKNW